MMGIANRNGSSDGVNVPSTQLDPRSAVLTLAYSPEKADLITELVDAFNDPEAAHDRPRSDAGAAAGNGS